MLKFRWMIYGALLLALAAAAPAAQAQRGAPAPPSIQEIKPGVYVVTGLGGNTTVQVTSEGLVVVDTKNLGDANYTALMEQIRTVTDQPVRYAIVTHVHQDHSGGTGKFQEDGIPVVAHENLVRNLETYTSNAGVPATPDVTYTDSYVIQLGGVEVQANHYAPAHTSGDTVVYFVNAGVVALGDELSIPNWNSDYAQGGSVLGWQRSFAQVAALPFDIAVPGHGAPITKEEFLDYQSRFDTFVARAIEAVRSGVAKEDLMARIQQDDLGWNITMPEGVRLDGFYAELQSAAQ